MELEERYIMEYLHSLVIISHLQVISEITHPSHFNPPNLLQVGCIKYPF